MIAEGLGWTLTKVNQTIQPVVAKRGARTKSLNVKRGRVAGLHQVGRGFIEGKEVITLDFWAYIGAQESTDSTVIKGTPDVDFTIKGGVHGDLATAAIVINSIPKVINAAPGLVTMKDLPVPTAILHDVRTEVRV